MWVDETGSDAHTNIRQFGCFLLGQSPQYTRLLTHRKRVSAIAAISSEGLLGVELKSGSVNGDAFFDFVRGTLVPNMQPLNFDGSNSRSIVIMDNCSIHHVDAIKELLQNAGILLLFLPPYSPDFNPIEEAFSSVKYYLKCHDDVEESHMHNIIQKFLMSPRIVSCTCWYCSDVMAPFSRSVCHLSNWLMHSVLKLILFAGDSASGDELLRLPFE